MLIVCLQLYSFIMGEWHVLTLYITASLCSSPRYAETAYAWLFTFQIIAEFRWFIHHNHSFSHISDTQQIAQYLCASSFTLLISLHAKGNKCSGITKFLMGGLDYDSQSLVVAIEGLTPGTEKIIHKKWRTCPQIPRALNMHSCVLGLKVVYDNTVLCIFRIYTVQPGICWIFAFIQPGICWIFMFIQCTARKKYTPSPRYWNVPVLVNTGTILVYQYCLKMWYLCSLERAGVIQKLTILERKNGPVSSNTRVPVSGTWSILFLTAVC